MGEGGVPRTLDMKRSVLNQNNLIFLAVKFRFSTLFISLIDKLFVYIVVQLYEVYFSWTLDMISHNLKTAITDSVV